MLRFLSPTSQNVTLLGFSVFIEGIKSKWGMAGTMLSLEGGPEEAPEAAPEESQEDGQDKEFKQMQKEEQKKL